MTPTSLSVVNESMAITTKSLDVLSHLTTKSIPSINFPQICMSGRERIGGESTKIKSYLSFSSIRRVSISRELKSLEEFFVLENKGSTERFSWPKLNMADS